MKTTATVTFALVVNFSEDNEDFEILTRHLARLIKIPDPTFHTFDVDDIEIYLYLNKKLQRYAAKYSFEINDFAYFLQKWDFVQSYARYKDWHIEHPILKIKHPEGFYATL